MKTDRTRKTVRFVFTLLASALALELSFAGEVSGQATETARLENRAKANNERLLDDGRGGQRHNREAPAEGNDSYKKSESSQTIATSGTQRLSSIHNGPRHFNQKPTANVQTRNAPGLNFPLPVLNKPAGATKEGFTPRKMEPQRIQPVRPPVLKLSTPVADAVHTRTPAAASVGGASASAKNNAALNGLNGTGMKHKP